MKDSIVKLIERLNDLKILQDRGDWAECLPEDIWETYFQGNFKELAHNLEVDTHRWFETSTTVIEIDGVFMGINYITNMFSENQGYDDCFHHLEFKEMEEFTTVSYRAI